MHELSREQLRARLEQEHGLHDNPRAEYLFAAAWNAGHHAGNHSVIEWYMELLPLVQGDVPPLTESEIINAIYRGAVEVLQDKELDTHTHHVAQAIVDRSKVFLWPRQGAAKCDSATLGPRPSNTRNMTELPRSRARSPRFYRNDRGTLRT